MKETVCHPPVLLARARTTSSAPKDRNPARHLEDIITEYKDRAADAAKRAVWVTETRMTRLCESRARDQSPSMAHLLT
jgi:hypothetical protein